MIAQRLTEREQRAALLFRWVLVGLVGLVVACAALGMLAGGASAQVVFGEGFGVAEINDGGGPKQDPPALPDVDRAFWAGTCDRGVAPAPGAPIPGGIGSRPLLIDVPANLLSGGFEFSTVPEPAVPRHCLDWGKEAPYQCSSGPAPCPNSGLWDPAKLPSWRQAPVTQAGAHPDATAMFHMERNQSTEIQHSGSVDGAVDNIVAELPAGLVGDPTAATKCSGEQFAVRPLECPASSQVGVLNIRTETSVTSGSLAGTDSAVHPVYSLEPREGNLAEFGVAYLSSERATTARIVAKARTHGDFGVSTFVAQVPAVLPLISQQITLWGVPWAAANDMWRAAPATVRIPHQGLPPGERVAYDSSWGEIRPFIYNPTECTGGPLQTILELDSFENPGVFDSEGYPVLPAGFPDHGDPSTWQGATAPAPPVTGCEKPPFSPTLALDGAEQADAPSGLAATLVSPQNDDPPSDVAENPSDTAGAPAHWRSDDGVGTAQLRSVRVTLPAGWSVNPSAAAGLEGCSDAQMGVTQQGSPPLFDNEDPFDGQGVECPAGSRIGVAQIDTPVLEDPIEGDVVLGMPKSTDPQSGEMFRLFLVTRAPEFGLVAKVAGSAVANPSTGQLTTTFQQNPRVPLEQVHLDLKGGTRGMLATPQRCASPSWSATLTPWTAAHDAGGQPVDRLAAMATSQRCANTFAPGQTGGSSPRTGRSQGTFTLRFTRPDGQQWLRAATVEAPRGLLASVRGVPLCSNAQAAANSCPASSRIGTVDAAAGAGDPFVLERKGAVYFTEGYKGAPYGLAISVPVEAGPFRGALALAPIVVRAALHVDRRTAQPRVVTDPLPLIHHGIPLRMRETTVRVDRPNFILNPSDCSPKQIRTTFTSNQGATALATTPFQASGCSRLAFSPKLSMRLTGKRQTRSGGHPGVRAQVTQAPGQAGIKRAEVRLPRDLVLDEANARALCEFVDGTKPDLENHCPPGSVVGRARATSPLLNQPLTGNVYFVKNIRIDPQTGNARRTLPMIVAALRGEIAINLHGESSVTDRNQLVSTFNTIPDAPINRFNLNITGGQNGILVVTENRRGKINLCRTPQKAISNLDAHNNKHHDRTITLKTPCTKTKKPRCKTKAQKQTRTCQRRAKRKTNTRRR